MRAAFLLSHHPAINHALLLREIRELRALGMEIHTVSLRPADRPAQQLTEEECDEQQRTFYVNPLGLLGACRYHLPWLIRHPARYVGGMVQAITLAGWNLAKTPRLLAYFAQAVIIGVWMEQRGLKHVNVQYSSTVGLLLRRMFAVDMSISFHGPDEFNDPGGFWLREKIEASQFVRAISYYSRSQLMKACDPRHWHKIEMAYMGIDPEAFRARPYRAKPEPFEILCVGRLAPVKAQHILLESVELLRSAGRKVRLHLAGGGPDLESLKQAARQKGIEDAVVLHGWVVQAELDALYTSADAFVLSSFAEGLPGVLMEAMAMQIPCISTWITGVPELIRDGIDGLLAPPADPEGFAQKVMLLMDDPQLRQRIGEGGRRRVMERFHLRRNAAHLSDIFSKYLDQGG